MNEVSNSSVDRAEAWKQMKRTVIKHIALKTVIIVAAVAVVEVIGRKIENSTTEESE